ncbi:MAG TPA: peptidoglycan DD-metalloendopeptidase family protein [Gemmatimonadales bacterium]|jgi:murein DD-endopeptidase MepM/ murein hydrolase activator NlpD|nr:peptidoglycan DD-metalloendopeptidase family protein [Gemmatimonadales bacterium]
MRNAATLALLTAAPFATAAAQALGALPDSSGWGVHVLAIARAPDSAIWVGTYGQGIFVFRKGAGSWERVRSSRDTAAHSISWDFVHAFGFGPRGQVWYGTVGNGWGLSTDGGKTWRNWEFRQLGPEWQYVTPNGIVTRGDTTYIATADGIKVTWDDGQSWHVITDSLGATTTTDPLLGRIQNQYVTGILTRPPTELYVRHLRGSAVSTDGGRSWRETKRPSRTDPGYMKHMRAIERELVDFGMTTTVCGAPEVPVATAWLDPLTIGGVMGTPWGLAEWYAHQVRCLTPPYARSTAASAAPPTSLRHTWFRRPIALSDQAYIDQTYRFGSTMGGNFQPHQGVEFNNPDGTPVHAVGSGVVVHAGPAEQGALTVAIKHDRRLPGTYYIFSVYYHNSKLLVKVGDRVKTGDVIALVGNTGRATNDHLHLEVHASPYDSTRLIVDPAVRYPPFNANPELWIEPLPGTGIVAGQVWDSAGKPVQQARIYGLVKPEPQETPFSFIETYGPRNHSDPVYGEHFAISDVPPGEYVLGVEIGGKRVFRRVKVEAGRLTWVEFRPER